MIRSLDELIEMWPTVVLFFSFGFLAGVFSACRLYQWTWITELIGDSKMGRFILRRCRCLGEKAPSCEAAQKNAKPKTKPNRGKRKANDGGLDKGVLPSGIIALHNLRFRVKDLKGGTKEATPLCPDCLLRTPPVFSGMRYVNADDPEEPKGKADILADTMRSPSAMMLAAMKHDPDKREFRCPVCKKRINGERKSLAEWTSMAKESLRHWHR